MNKRTIGLMAIALLFLRLPIAAAQQIGVQQPSLETFGVGTTVSVPDRGRTALGGVGRSAASRSMYGPIRTGTSLGLSSQGSSLSIGARIHDLAEMDRAALEAAGKARKTRADVELSGQAQHAFETLQSRSHAAERSGRAGSGTSPSAGAIIAASEHEGASRELSAEKLLDRAKEAETQGKRKLALTYLRAARDQGARQADKEIARLSLKTR